MTGALAGLLCCLITLFALWASGCIGRADDQLDPTEAWKECATPRGAHLLAL